MSAEKDFKLVMDYLSTPVLILVSNLIHRGKVRSSNFNHCIMHYLSFVARDRYEVHCKESFVRWITSLTDESRSADLELAARRLVRGYDEAYRDQNGITLDGDISSYYRRYPLEYLLTDSHAKHIIDCEICRRIGHRLIPRQVAYRRRFVRPAHRSGRKDKGSDLLCRKAHFASQTTGVQAFVSNAWRPPVNLRKLSWKTKPDPLTLSAPLSARGFLHSL